MISRPFMRDAPGGSRAGQVDRLASAARFAGGLDGVEDGETGPGVHDRAATGVDGAGEVVGEAEVVLGSDPPLPGLARRLAAIVEGDRRARLVDDEAAVGADDVQLHRAPARVAGGPD